MATRTKTSDPPAALVALADPVRWRIVELLGREELCVCHLVEELAVAQPLVSHHLKVLRDAGLVTGERWRYWTYYQLLPDAVAEVLDALAGAIDPAPTRDRRPCC
jgi:ArsR family transcriptional regulator